MLLEALDNFVQGRDGLVEGCHSVLRIVSRKITSELPSSEMGIASREGESECLSFGRS